MLSRFETQYRPSPEDFMKMRRTRRFRSEPDHATRGSLSRSSDKTKERITTILHRTATELKAARAGIQEAMSGESTRNIPLDLLPSTLQEQPIAVKPETLVSLADFFPPELRGNVTS